MRRVKASSVLPWFWTACVAVATSWLALRVAATEGLGSPAELVAGIALFVSFPAITALGAYLRMKVPENPISWVFFFMGAGLPLVGWTASVISVEVPPLDPGITDYLALLLQGPPSSILVFYPFFFMLFVFPTGRFLNRRWRWALHLGVGMAVLTFLMFAFAETFRPGYVEDPWHVDNPVGFIPVAVADAVGGGLGLVAMLFLAVGGVVALVVRYRSATAETRAQIRWLLYPGVLFPLTLIATALSEDVSAIALLPFALVPVAIFIAITRYRLYEIDRIISRTIAYTMVVGALASVYVVGAVWLPTQILGEQPATFVAGTTLAVIALFNPIRRRVQRWVDRRFNRTAYEAAILAEQFASRMKKSMTVDELAGAWLATVEATLQPEFVSVWVRDVEE